MTETPVSRLILNLGIPTTISMLITSIYNMADTFFVSQIGTSASGAVGVVRRDPMAMRPFAGYNMGDYFAHWLEMGKMIPHAPKIFHVNWFRTDDEGHFIWPGFGDNSRVLKWIFERCDGEGKAVETPIGYMPTVDAIDRTGIENEVTEADMKELLSFDKEGWKKELEMIKEHYAKFDRLPAELNEQLKQLEERLSK